MKLASNIQTDQVDAAGPMDTVDGKAKIVTIPAEADYLIANSTVPGKCDRFYIVNCDASFDL